MSAIGKKNGHCELHCTCPLLVVKRTSRPAASLSLIAVTVDVASMAMNRVGGIASDSILASQSFDAQQGLPGVKISRWQIWTGSSASLPWAAAITPLATFSQL